MLGSRPNHFDAQRADTKIHGPTIKQQIPCTRMKAYSYCLTALLWSRFVSFVFNDIKKIKLAIFWQLFSRNI